MAGEDHTPDWIRDYVIKSGEAIQRIPEILRQSEEHWRQFGKVMNDELATHNANTNKLVEALGIQSKAIELHSATTDACLKEVKEGTTRDQKVITWALDTFKWIVVAAVTAVIAIAGGGEILKYIFGAG